MNHTLSMASRDPRLSARARGLLMTYVMVHGGDVPAARVMAEELREGRDAIRTAMRELSSAGYIAVVQYQTRSGQWFKKAVVVPQSADIEPPRTDSQASATEDGFSGHLPSGYPKTTAGNQPMTTEPVVLPPSGGSTTGARLTARQEGNMGYDFFDEPAPQQPKTKRAKPTDKRSGKAPGDWNINDMVAEFDLLASEHTADRAGQVNYAALRGSLSRYRQRASASALVLGIRDFFADPANVRDVGTGPPLWKRFLGWFPTHQTRLEVATGAEAAAADQQIEQMAAEMAQRRRRY